MRGICEAWLPLNMIFSIVVPDMADIKFGTSGWRARISEEFTFESVRRLTAAVAQHVKSNLEFGMRSAEYKAFCGKANPHPAVVVAYDTRFLSPEFAHQATEVFAAQDVQVILAAEDTPTPVAAYAVLNHKALGGVVITASHNPASDNGYKWMPYWGGAAPVAVTDELENRAGLLSPSAVHTMPLAQAIENRIVAIEDFKPAYLKHLASLLDLNVLKNSRMKIGVDCLYGTARHYLRPFLEKLGFEVHAIHEERDVLFGGRPPEPTESSMAELKALMSRRGLSIGLACDGDADRFGILDAQGVWISANDILGLVLYHLIKNRGRKGKVARSVMSSHFMDAVAKSFQLETRETPVGFKHIGELLRTGAYLMGGEESAGLSIGGHIPEKDGILACLLVLELAATEKKPLVKIREELFRQVGAFYNQRHNFHLKHPEQVIKLQHALETRPPLELAGSSVWRINQDDGFKFLMKDGSWLGFRSSGTEPMIRLYLEASSPEKLSRLLQAGKKVIAQITQ